VTAQAGEREPPVFGVRGHAISFSGDPFLSEDAMIDVEDALIVCCDGRVVAFGPYAQTRGELPEEARITHHERMLLCAGFVDAHVHYVQTRIAGAPGERLIGWLERYAFAEEQRFGKRAYANAVARLFFDAMLASGTTTACVFCATHPSSVDAFFEESVRRGTRMIAGKTLMDRDAPGALLDTPQGGCEQSRDLIGRWHGRGRNLYAIAPRSALTSSSEQLEAAGALWAASPGTYVHTHISENLKEIERVGSLFPDASGYLDIYDRRGLLGPRAVLAHGVHLTEPERERLQESGAALAHCPTSNLFLGSGLFDMRAAKDPSRPLKVGLGSDIGAGTSLSLLTTMNEAYKVGALQANHLTAAQLFYLATLGGAQAVCLEEEIGSIAVGKEADFVVLDPRATPLLRARSERVESTEELLFALALLGDERAVAATYVGGRLAYERAPNDAMGHIG
jgi:guanine deaminase